MKEQTTTIESVNECNIENVLINVQELQKQLKQIEKNKNAKDVDESIDVVKNEIKVEIEKGQKILSSQLEELKAQLKSKTELANSATLNEIIQDIEKAFLVVEKNENISKKNNKLQSAKEMLESARKLVENSINTTSGTSDFDFTRNSTLVTLFLVDKFENLNTGTEQGGNEKFIEQTRKLWTKLAVHGKIGVNKKGEPIIQGYTDLDGNSAIGLFKEAGLKTDDLNYIRPEEYKAGRINLDTGNKEGLVILDKDRNEIDFNKIKPEDLEQKNITVIFDHHGKESKDDSSTTQLVYKTLTQLELLKQEKYLDKLVEFVTQEDNKTYPLSKEDFEKSDKTLRGLARFVKFLKLKQFFKDGHGPDEKLSEEDLKKYRLIYEGNKNEIINRSKEQKKVIDQSLEEIKRLETEESEFIVPSDQYGKIVIDVGNKISGGFDAVRACVDGCGAYIKWCPEKNSFFISVIEQNKFPDDFELKQGVKVRNKMYIKPLIDKTPLTVTLKEILGKMTNNKLEPKGELKKILDKEKEIKTSGDEKLLEKKMEEWKDLSLSKLQKLPEFQKLEILEDGEIVREAKMQIVERKIDEDLDSKEEEIRKTMQEKTNKTGPELEALVQKVKIRFKEKVLTYF